MHLCKSFALSLLTCLIGLTAFGAEPPLKLLFLGDGGHHQPARRFAELAPALQERGVELTYTDQMSALSETTLNKYDGLVVYANIDRIEQPQADALLKYVSAGHGFVPLHCASFCFRNNAHVVALIGAQFKSHGVGVFTTRTSQAKHPILQGFDGLTSWDETYVHTLHNTKNRTVLEYREEEPWTWVRTHGKGRVFYTAWGHDARTWKHAGFQNLVERGIRWACGDDPSKAGEYHNPDRFIAPAMVDPSGMHKPFEYVEVGPKIPDYKAGNGKVQTQMQKPLSPAESQRRIAAPQGFSVKLWADEQHLDGKPIAMNWDARGRLWICETVDYPNDLQPPRKGRDRIRICEDTNHDGVADRFTLFAEGLSIPTAITFWRGGAVVQNGIETLYLKDTNGDGRADQRIVLMSGWGLGDTHGGVSNFRYGLDNWIWGMQGYNNSAPQAPGQSTQAFRMGFFRFRLTQTDPPRVEAVEFLRSTNNNTWGLGFSEEGLAFGSTANRNPSVFMPIPNRYYERVQGWSPSQLGSIADTHLFKPLTDRVRQVDHHGGYTAAAGHALYTARTYPPQWWNKTAFVCGPTGHLVGTFVLRRDGAGYQSTSPTNLIASDDEWTAPIAAEVGPDGNVWVIDWYNYIVQHNPTPQGFKTGRGNAYISELRDKTHGRIYRVTYNGGSTHPATTPPPAVLASDDPESLLSGLRHPAMVVRLNAQRLLVHRGNRDVTPQLTALVQEQLVDSVGLNVGAIHALRTLQGLEAITPDAALPAVVAALSHPSAGVRLNAIKATPKATERVPDFVRLTSDTDAQVALAALLALSDTPPSNEAGVALVKLVSDPHFTDDPWLRDALTSAAAMHSAGFFLGLAKSDQSPPNVQTLRIVRIVAEHVARGKPDELSTRRMLLAAAKTDSRLAEVIVTGATAGWPKTHSIDLQAYGEALFLHLLEEGNAATKSQLIRVAPRWGVSGLEKHMQATIAALLSKLKDPKAPADERIAAARQAIDLQPQSAPIVASILAEISPQTPPDLAAGLIESLLGGSSPEAAPLLIKAAARLTPATRTVAIRVLLAKPASTAALLDHLESGSLSATDLSLEQRQALSVHPEPKIRDRAVKLLSAGGGLPSPDRDRVLKEKLTLVAQSGDAQVGHALFKKHCAKCHKHRGEGADIGPDLSGMAVHPKAELLTHLLDPSRSVEGNFRAYTLITESGRIFTGMLASESKTTVELVDAEAKRHAIQRSDIDELIASRKSLMPDGFEKQLTDKELVDLLEFMTEKGPYLPLPLGKFATVVSTKGMFYSESAQAERLIFPDWKPKTFAGVPFVLTDPQGTRTPNVIMLYGPGGATPPKMPKRVSLPCNTPAKAIHLLSGVSGWGAKQPGDRGVSMIVRLYYADDQTEDHPLIDGKHFADYIGVFNVPESKLAFKLRDQQIRYLAVYPERQATIKRIELVKGPDATAPIVMAITLETPK